MEALNCPSNTSSLIFDTACLQVSNDLNHSVDLYSVSSECIQCDGSFWTTIPARTVIPLVVSARRPIVFSAVKNVTNQTICHKTVSFVEHEVASCIIEKDGQCNFSTLDAGDDPYYPLYFHMILIPSLWLLLVVGRALHSFLCSRRIRSIFTRNSVIMDMENDLGNPNSSSTDSLPLVQSELVPLRRMNRPRILALDTFRGLTITLMIFVNYGGGKYWFFEHSAWNGLTVADVVFPWFAWVMGVSMVLSFRSKLRSCESRCTVFSMARRRALTLVLLGLLVNMYNSNNLATARYCGVLQRLGITYFIVSVVEILFMKKQPGFQRGRWMQISELADSWRQWLVILSLVAAQVYVSLYLVVPGCPTGYLGPGGTHNHSSAPNCTGGAARYIDSLIFKDNHLYSHGPVKKVYHTLVPFDPEGLLGTLTTCLTVYLGVQAGYILLSYNSTLQRCSRWLFWALITGVAAGFLCNWSEEGGIIPVNKPLWSLSYALITSSTAFFLFSILFLVIDHFNWLSADVFRFAGMNAILLYLGHILMKNTFPWSWQPYHLTSHFELLSMNVIGVCIWLYIARILHHSDIYLTI